MWDVSLLWIITHENEDDSEPHIKVNVNYGTRMRRAVARSW